MRILFQYVVNIAEELEVTVGSRLYFALIRRLDALLLMVNCMT